MVTPATLTRRSENGRVSAEHRLLHVWQAVLRQYSMVYPGWYSRVVYRQGTHQAGYLPTQGVSYPPREASYPPREASFLGREPTLFLGREPTLFLGKRPTLFLGKPDGHREA